MIRIGVRVRLGVGARVRDRVVIGACIHVVQEVVQPGRWRVCREEIGSLACVDARASANRDPAIRLHIESPASRLQKGFVGRLYLGVEEHSGVHARIGEPIQRLLKKGLRCDHAVRHHRHAAQAEVASGPANFREHPAAKASPGNIELEGMLTAELPRCPPLPEFWFAVLTVLCCTTLQSAAFVTCTAGDDSVWHVAAPVRGAQVESRRHTSHTDTSVRVSRYGGVNVSALAGGCCLFTYEC